MYDIRKLKAGDLFYYVHSHWWLWELKVLVPFSEETGCLKAVSTEDGRMESIDASSLGNFFKTKEEAERIYKDAAEDKIRELTEISTLLETFYKEHGGTESFDTVLYKHAIDLARGTYGALKPRE